MPHLRHFKASRLICGLYANRTRLDIVLKLRQWRYNPQTGELIDGQQQQRLPEQPRRLLNLLIAAGANELVSREQAIAELWPDDRIVEFDQSLNTCMRKLRKALGDDPNVPEFVQTIPGKGYRLLVAAKPARTAKLAYWQIVLALLATALVFANLMRGTALDEKPALVVMPVSGLADNSHTSHLAHGIREELLLQLAKVPTQELLLVGKTSASSWRDQDSEVIAPGYMLYSSLQEDALQFRLHFRLQSENDELLWAQAFNWLKGAGSHQQQEIISGVIEQLASVLSFPVPVQSAQTIPLTGEALGLFNQGRYLLAKPDPKAKQNAVFYLEQALAIAPDNIDILVNLASAWQQLGAQDSVNRSKHFYKAQQYLEKLLSLQPEHPLSLYTLAFLQLYGDWRPGKAKQSLQRALALQPNSADAHSLLAAVYATLAEHDLAVKQAKLAKDLDPLSMTVNADLCWYLNFASLFNEAIAECGQILALEPGAVWTRLGLLEALLQKQDWPAAMQQLNLIQQKTQSQNNTVGPQEFQQAYRSWIDGLEIGYQKGLVEAYSIATAYGQINDAGRSQYWLEKAFADKNGFAVFAKIDSRLNTVRTEPSIRNLLQQHLNN